MNDWISSNYSFWASINAFFGAALGASFYVLVKTQPFLANRSYDPKYNASYISRFFTGVIGGMILAIALGPLLQMQLEGALGQALSPGVVAMLGGFSARAVELILQRFVEVLLAAVRGDGSDDAKNRLATATAAKDNVVKKSLDAVIDAQLNGATPARIKALLDSARDEVAKPVRF